jgi:hypothetical protein
MAIQFSDWGSDKYNVDGDKGYPTLEKACERIDDLLKLNVDKTPVFWETGYRDELKQGIATSVNVLGMVFVSHPEKKGKYGSREQLDSREAVFLDTPENRTKYEEIKAIRVELKGIVKAYQVKAAEVVKTMKQIREPKN